ncbi:hypothetical protein UC34_23855 [Pandoraea vervacti]|uniref:ESPR domain-containing protein n=1 Tax=Pandoraea vervacti TaxID=656178 RepID=A0ABN4FUL4_9BURK|nr:hypothetical protein UC34_03445 [Pandoraea vervacti]AJP56795.1 hypothetical protein UC34_06935 [Pandoraea vervacti]AJP57405.1 hypothetical protein UC34_11045 [Pandoraea vervacti]AJP58950.1 hypothetical protein UC34_22435 [Pandoraea vervacti]AJP59164.1 hypothetical protein UC34_23855 [Pandoraea vervacti]
MAPADDATSHFQEGFVNDCEALEADSQSLEVVQPRDGSLDNPTRLAKTAAVRLAAASNLGGDADGVQGLAVLVVVVAAITLNDVRFRQGATALASNRRNRLDQWQQLGNVVAVGAREYQRQWNALGVGQDVVL